MIVVDIVKLDNQSQGICYVNNKICFVKGAIVGDVVEIEIIKEYKNYCIGKIIRFINLSSNHIKSCCPYFGLCGGCQLDNVSFEYENKYKYDNVKNIFNKYNIDSNLLDDICYINKYNYRNKILLHCDFKNLGLYKDNSYDIVSIDKCLLVDDKINYVISLLNNYKEYIKEVLIRISNDSKYVLVKITGVMFNYNELLDKVDVLIINNKVVSGDKYIISNIGNYNYYIDSECFFQVNKFLTSFMYNYIRDSIIDLNINNALDLYCGVSSIGIYISKYVNNIIGIDYNKNNIECGLKSIKLNNINNIELICDRVENRIDSFKDIDLILVDPPRSGLDKKTINYINKINSKYLIYVSCNIMTLVSNLCDLVNYDIMSIKIFNMFFRTKHCESITVLERR